MAHALPTFPGIADSIYHFKPGGVIKSASCNLCHSGTPNAEHLNPYGKDVQAALDKAHSRTITASILHSLDNKDSDGDGFTNAEEFAADTLPGDPNSKPAGKPTPPTGGSSTSAEKPTSMFGTIVHLMFPPHAQHPVLVHFPIALFIIAMFFDLLAYWKKNPSFSQAAYLNLTVAAVMALAAIATGLLAWQFQYQGAALEGNLLYHLILGLVTTGIIWGMWWMRLVQLRTNKALGAAYVLLALAGLIVISITGHLGGVLSGVDQ